MILLRSFIHSHKLLKFYSNLIQENQLCFDIGANVGKKSKLFLKIGARVIAFEPQKECLTNLAKIKKSNKRFEFYPVAIDSKDGTKELQLSNYSEIATLSDSFVSLYGEKGVNWLNRQLVKTISINTAIEKYGLPHFCKIDIEGYEFEVLSNLKYNIPLIEFEVVAGFKEKAINTIIALNNEFASYNYTLNEQPFFQLSAWVDINKISSIITKLPDNRFHANIFIKKNSSTFTDEV